MNYVIKLSKKINVFSGSKYDFKSYLLCLMKALNKRLR